MAFKAGKYRIGMNSNANAFVIIMQIVMLILWFYVGDQIISVIRGITNTVAVAPEGGIYGTGPTYVTYYWTPETNVFYNAFQLMGLHTNDIGFTSGLVGVVGLLMAVAVLMQAIRVTRV